MCALLCCSYPLAILSHYALGVPPDPLCSS
jgi:hypothetical protein